MDTTSVKKQFLKNGISPTTSYRTSIVKKIDHATYTGTAQISHIGKTSHEE
jgi:hypothetical protein